MVTEQLHSVLQSILLTIDCHTTVSAIDCKLIVTMTLTSCMLVPLLFVYL